MRGFFGALLELDGRAVLLLLPAFAVSFFFNVIILTSIREQRDDDFRPLARCARDFQFPVHLFNPLAHSGETQTAISVSDFKSAAIIVKLQANSPGAAVQARWKFRTWRTSGCWSKLSAQYAKGFPANRRKLRQFAAKFAGGVQRGPRRRAFHDSFKRVPKITAFQSVRPQRVHRPAGLI